MKEFVVRNPSATEEVILFDLGITVEPSTDRILSNECSREEIDRSIDLENAIQSGTLIVLENGQELSSEQGLDQLKYAAYGISELKVVDELPTPAMFRSVILYGHETLDPGIYVCSANTVWVQWIGL